MQGTGARITIYRPAAVGLAELGLLRPMPECVRADPLAPARFDAGTMFFDVFRSGSGVLCLGPPLAGCLPPGADLSVRDADGSPLPHRLDPPRIRQQHASRLSVDRAGPGDRLRLAAAGRATTVAVKPSHAGLLAGRRVIVTLSRDNPLAWIRDWAAFHVRLHGADAVLLYDNGSADYAPEDIAAALAGIPGLAEIVVVPWPFPYGQGVAPEPRAPAADNFCQTGALDHARRCLCPDARSVLNLDIDELVPPGEVPIFAAVEESPFALLLFYGIWAEAPGIDGPDAARAVRHRDCAFVWRSQVETLAEGRSDGLCRTKWVAVPSRCDPDVEWGVHDIYPATDEAHRRQRSWRRLDRTNAFRHCRQINTGWKNDRWRSSDEAAVALVPDREMAAAFTRAFGPERPDPGWPAPRI